MNYIKCEINWQFGESTLNGRVFLFCIGADCMSGKVLEVKKLVKQNFYELKVSFIEAKYFQNVADVGNKIKIQEASKILSEGVITSVA
ncbi:hypothetical protein [Aureibacter tunicatorum]|uniref:ABC-type uncharacterized transport system substrate-binding protein n=1 Tax=Aureibacter tunicatorum TaxID=866807 RepID=A0AAE4BS29_9BACT|nr:hypothetical protein [Aureibacter tunicatorum]MDR6239321.1 ABC-type uncharacterized transport system substrate-binding protein [Aureibacter tunicatorum]BDD04756.1 hypothetical protein AUTU_22390 [Aureibacter tunicatorum]